MFDFDNQAKGVIITCLLTWCISFTSAWVAYTNTITELKTNQITLIQNNKDLNESLKKLVEKVAENTRDGAVTNSVLNRLNSTLVKIDGSLDKIVQTSAINTTRISALENIKR